MRKLVIYGDSISTTGCGEGGYQVKLTELLPFDTVCNHAVSASGLAKGTPNSLISVLEDDANLHADADLVLLWHGTNDWYWGTPLGCETDTDPYTYYGGLKTAVERIRQAAPQAKIMAFTPLFRIETPDGCDTQAEAYDNPNKLGLTLAAYRDALLKTGARYSFPVVDLRTLTNFNLYNYPVYMPDKVHPSKSGCDIIAGIMARHIKLYGYDAK